MVSHNLDLQDVLYASSSGEEKVIGNVTSRCGSSDTIKSKAVLHKSLFHLGVIKRPFPN